MLHGEIHPREGTTIQQSITLVADIYDGSGRLIAHKDHIHFYADSFFGFETFKIENVFHVPDLAISKVRLYPKPY